MMPILYEPMNFTLYGHLAKHFSTKRPRPISVLNQTKGEVYTIRKDKNRIVFDLDGIKFAEPVDSDGDELMNLVALFDAVLISYEGDTFVVQ